METYVCPNCAGEVAAYSLGRCIECIECGAMGWELIEPPELVQGLALFEGRMVEGVAALRQEIVDCDRELDAYHAAGEVAPHRRTRVWRAALQHALDVLIEHNAGNDITEENRIA